MIKLRPSTATLFFVRLNGNILIHLLRVIDSEATRMV
jgi:hypothetical protein